MPYPCSKPKHIRSLFSGVLTEVTVGRMWAYSSGRGHGRRGEWCWRKQLSIYYIHRWNLMVCQCCLELTLVGMGRVFLEGTAIRTWNTCSINIVPPLVINSCIYSSIRSECHIIRNPLIQWYPQKQSKREWIFRIKPPELGI